MKLLPSDQDEKATSEMSRFDQGMLEKQQPQRKPLPIQKIVVPIDFSEFSYKSLDYASAFAVQSQAQILLLHVVPLNYVDAELIAFDYAELEKQSADAARVHLKKLIEERLDPKVDADLRVVIGRPVDEIIKAAEEYGADMIIMSTHGYTGLKHAFLGSTTETIVRSAPCPVLTVRLREHDFISAPSKESANDSNLD